MSNSIIINSAQRTSMTDSPTEFKLKYTFPIETGAYMLKYVCMPFTINTINQNNNSFLLNGSVVSLPISDHLTVESLRLSLETTLKSVSLSFTVSNILTINNTSNFTLDLTNYDSARILGFQK